MKVRKAKFAFAAVLILSGLGFVSSAAGQVSGLDALSGYDHLLVWRDGVDTAMISSTSPANRNIDFSHYHGLHRGQRVIFRADGPGCIYRLWSALPAGTVSFYLDGSKHPALKCDFKEFLENGCGRVPSFSVGRTAQYLPVCYERSAVVTTVGFDWLAFYQVSYQTFPGEEAVETFVPGPDAGDPEGLAAAKVFWDSNGASDLEARSLIRKKAELRIAPGETAIAAAEKGSGIIRELRLKDRDDPSRNLSGLRLLIFTDASSQPDVDAPAHAFFGSYYDSRMEWPEGRWSSLAFEAGPEGFTCRLPMPFRKGIRIKLENSGDETRRLDLEYRVERKESPPGTMRLHAGFRKQDYPTDVTRKTTYGILRVYDPSDNYVVLDRRGTGYYVGCFLYVQSVGPDWWGEGDENTWVDGDAWPPVIQGTGTEDEFNWSWGYSKYMTPISGILIKTPEGTAEGETAPNAAYRFRVSDYVPFRESIKVSYERQGAVSVKRYPGAYINQSRTRGDDYASVAYWYELPESPR